LNHWLVVAEHVARHITSSPIDFSPIAPATSPGNQTGTPSLSRPLLAPLRDPLALPPPRSRAKRKATPAEYYFALFAARVSAAFLAAAFRLRVKAAFFPAARLFRVNAAFRAASFRASGVAAAMLISVVCHDC
jgi:hypothetical protein